MNSVRPIEPPTVPSVPDEPARPITAALDAGWGFADEAAATDGGLMGNPDAVLAAFPPGPTDADIAAIVDEFTDAICRPRPRVRRPAPRR